jgi:hypothetical protein
VVYATTGLADALLAIAADRDPQSVTMSLTTMTAPELDGDLPREADVFTDFYLPDTGRSVRAVFGVDLGTPGAEGRFVSHPDGLLALTREDDLHEVVFVAVPPYTRDTLTAFDRGGRELGVELVDAAPPVGTLDY